MSRTPSIRLKTAAVVPIPSARAQQRWRKFGSNFCADGSKFCADVTSKLRDVTLKMRKVAKQRGNVGGEGGHLFRQLA